MKTEDQKVLQEENRILKEKIDSLMRGSPLPIQRYKGPLVRFGIVTDCHLGSLYARINWLQTAYKVFQSEGIENVYHAGDVVDGEKMYRGQEYELNVHGADAQSVFVVERYPRYQGITTYFILGNHDLSFWKVAGVNIGEKISQHRDDMKFLGSEEADIPITIDGGTVIVRLVHPGKGTAYALSYHPQKYIEALTGGEKPHVVIIGHYHKAEYLFYRNVHVIQGGTLQAQTPFMRRQNIAAMTGFWIVEFHIDGNSISRFKQEFFPLFSEKEGK